MGSEYSSWEIRDFKGKPLSSKFHEAFFTHVAISYTNLMPKKKMCIRKEFNSHRIFLVHQHRRFIVLEHE